MKSENWIKVLMPYQQVKVQGSEHEEIKRNEAKKIANDAIRNSAKQYTL